jgi:post-segregation antitoxin (ccd killing protein)
LSGIAFDAEPRRATDEIMKNITVSVDDDLYHRARVFAARKKTSVSALVKTFLAEVVEEESEFERLKREEQELRVRLFAEGGGLSSTDNLPRGEIYDHDLRGRTSMCL